jgi:hypothetical protein
VLKVNYLISQAKSMQLSTLKRQKESGCWKREWLRGIVIKHNAKADRCEEKGE